VKSCTFCVTDNECHEVGSLINPCTNDCCASESDLSTCKYQTVEEVDAVACNGFWDALVFDPGFNPASAAAAGTTAWPEAGRTNGKGTSVHFSGGGSRSLTLSIGQARALSRLGLLSEVEYMIGVSGGSWFLSAFTYAQGAESDEALLCPYAEPANITDDFLATVPDGCLLDGARTGAGLG